MLDSAVIILTQARVQVEVEARRARITAFFARIRARRTVVHPAVLADRIEFENLTASALHRIDEELHDCKQDTDQEELWQDAAGVLFGEFLSSFWFLVADDHVNCLLLKMVQFVEFIEEHGGFEDEVEHQRKFARNTEGLQVGQAEEISRFKLLLRQRGVVNSLKEQQWQDVYKEIESQPTADLPREILEVQQSVASREVGQWQDCVEHAPRLSMIRLLLVH